MAKSGSKNSIKSNKTAKSNKSKNTAGRNAKSKCKVAALLEEEKRKVNKLQIKTKEYMK